MEATLAMLSPKAIRVPAVRTQVLFGRRSSEVLNGRMVVASLPSALESPTMVAIRRPPQTTVVFDTYWRFAVERQAVYFRRLEGEPSPWTSDPTLQRFRFTNAYRAADRASQFLIRKVIYEGPQTPREVAFRTLLFRLFNLPSTWQALTAEFGQPEASSFDPSMYSAALARHAARGANLYSAAYVIPPVPQMGGERKHEQHLELVRWILADKIEERLGDASSLESVFDTLSSYPSLGRFLAFQLTIDLNYGPHLGFDEMDFVAAGPGAREGIAKCFAEREGWSDEDIIHWVTDRQEEEFDLRGLSFQTLWGRRLQLIDCQNLFCEIAKYSRVAHPEFTAAGGRHRMKRTYSAGPEIDQPWFPPKWGINERISPIAASRPSPEQLDLSLDQVQPKTTAVGGADRTPYAVRLQDRLLPLGR